MKRLVFALVLAVALPAAAQSRGGEDRPKVGLGVSVVPLEAGGASPTVEVYVPLNLAPQLRIEPSLGIATRNRPTGGTDTSDVTLGVGVFVLQRAAAPLDLYFGGRLKLNFASIDRPAAQGGNDSGTDVSIAGAVGGEYYLIPKFSTGLEGQLGFFSRSSASGDEATGFFTTGLVFLRMYM